MMRLSLGAGTVSIVTGLQVVNAGGVLTWNDAQDADFPSVSITSQSVSNAAKGTLCAIRVSTYAHHVKRRDVLYALKLESWLGPGGHVEVVWR